MRTVGHKGADLVVPGNTPASFDAAVEIGVDVIEFDVLPRDVDDRDGSELVLAHDHTRPLDEAPTLEEGLAHLACRDVDLIVDLKLPGYEARVAAALREHGLVGRSLVSSMYMRSLVALREDDPELELGWSVPRAERDYTASRVYALPALAVLAGMRRRAPARAAAHLRAGRCDAVMAYWRLVTPALVHAVRDAGGQLYAWTVDDAAVVARMRDLGVDGLITNDPRLLA